LRHLEDLDAEGVLRAGRLVRLDLRQKIYDANAPIDLVYFPLTCVLSVVAEMQDQVPGDAIVIPAECFRTSRKAMPNFGASLIAIYRPTLIFLANWLRTGTARARDLGRGRLERHDDLRERRSRRERSRTIRAHPRWTSRTNCKSTTAFRAANPRRGRRAGRVRSKCGAMREGKRIAAPPDLTQIREPARANLAQLPPALASLGREPYRVEIDAAQRELAAATDRRIAAANEMVDL